MADDSIRKIVYELQAKTNGFVDGIKSALTQTQNMVGAFAKNVQKTLQDAFSGGQNAKGFAQSFSNEFTIVQDTLFKAASAFERLKNSQLSWLEASKQAKSSTDEERDAYTVITEYVNRYGMSVKAAALAAIESGEARVGAVQKIINSEYKQVLSETELEGVVGKLRAKYLELAEAEGLYVNQGAQIDAINQKAAESADKAAKGTNNFNNRLQAIIQSFVLIRGVQGVIKIFQDAAQAGLDFAQAQYNLGVQVRAAGRVLGEQEAGSLAQWQARITQLREQLNIYSTTDITKAVTQTSVLTRVLGLNADQQQQVIKIASALAQTTGVDLSQAIDDVRAALGGSSIVLDKYGLFLRDIDKAQAAFQLGFTDKLQAGTQGLTSQQLALATLQTILKQTNPLFAELGDYQATLPGQIKATDAEIADQYKSIGENLSQFLLGFKLLWSEILDIVNGIANSPTVKLAAEQIEMLYKFKQLNTAQTNAGGNKTIMPGQDLKPAFWQGGGASGNFANVAPRGLDKGTGIKYYLDEQLKGDKAAIDAYKAGVQKEIDDARAKLIPQVQNIMGTKAQTGGLSPDERGEKSAAVPEVDTKLLEAQQKFGKDVVDAFKDFNRSQADALTKRNEDREKMDREYVLAVQKVTLEYGRKRFDANKDLLNKERDANIDYQRDLENLEIDQNNKREKILKEHNDKTEEIYADYYRKLNELNAQYYFDLQDAVAANDAVAIKHLERKYNLDKQKLDDNLQDQLDNQNSTTDQQLQQLTDETEQRKAELDKRHKEELEDLQRHNKDKLAELNLQQKREMEDLATDLDQKHQLQEIEYQNELDLIKTHYDQRLEDITDNLADEYDLQEQQFKDILDLYKEYYDEDGEIDKLLQEFYKRQFQLAGGEIQPTPGGTTPGQIPSNGGGNWLVTPNSFSTPTSSAPNTLYVTIGTDGTLSSDFIDSITTQISDELSNAIENIIISRGGSNSLRS